MAKQKTRYMAAKEAINLKLMEIFDVVAIY